MLVYQGKLILGGSFTLADSPYVSRLAAWDGSTWSAFDSYPPFDGAARALATDGDNLYVSWQGYDAGTGAYDHAYKYDGQTWTRIAYARGGHITSVASFNGEVYIGGGFTSVNDIPFYGIAKYGFATGLTDPFQPQQKLSLFPNPSQGRLHCQLPEAWQGLACSISLQDISGKSVLNLEYDGHTDIVLSVSALPTGIYTLSATTPQGTIHQKWVKE
jgi:hypothetical protein